MSAPEVSTESVMALCRRRAPHGLGGWSDDVLGRWLTARSQAGELSLFVERGRPVGLAAVTETEGDIEIPVLIGARWMIGVMLVHLAQRFPDWRSRSFLVDRHGIPKRWTAAHLLRLARIPLPA